VALERCGQVAGVTSRVGLDRFDVAKLQAGNTDLKWLSEVAVRHHEIVANVAQDRPVLPLRMGTLFESRASLLGKLAHYEVPVADFLRRLGDGQEWAVKVYLGGKRAEDPLPPKSFSSGAQYLAGKRQLAQRRQETQVAARRALPTLEARLQTLADAWQRLRPLPAALTGRAERMTYHGAFLLTRSGRQAFCAACEDFGRRLAPEGLILEVSGPWPPYHFCPAL
jgi:hypothetical protein